MGAAARVGTGALGAVAARLLWEGLRAAPPGGAQQWNRTNHAGETLTLLEGPAFAVAAALAAGTASGLPSRLRLAAVVATVGAGAFGALDDLGESGTSKGLRGHLNALRSGTVTTGAVKIAGIGATGLLAALLVSRRSPGGSRVAHGVDVLASGALIAGMANLFNLLDLRPGRALKAGLAAAPLLTLAGGPAAMMAAAASGPAVALLPEDLDEKAMLGDTGANALGALLGTAAAAATGRRTRWSLLAAVVGLTLASEKVSFSAVIESTPGLKEFDAWGRLPR